MSAALAGQTKRIKAWTLLLGRILIAGIFLWDGAAMARAPGLAADYMGAFGIPIFLLPAVILLQLGGGLLVVAGWQTRIVALAFAGYTVLTALIFHTDFANANELLQFGKDLAICGGFLLLAADGPGALSIDEARIASRNRK